MTSKQITILYGSQTGNAEDMSKRIGHKVKSLGLEVLIEAMDDFPLKLLPKQYLVIFVCSTTGHGQEPENMRNFYNFIRRRDLPSTCLSSLKYVVYGLGDSSYAKFNYVSKILFKRLKECGANPVQDLVTGDEQHELGCDGIIYPKLDELWLKLKDLNHCQAVLSESDKPENSYNASLYPSSQEEPVANDEFKPDFIRKYNIKTAFCTTNQRITSESHFQDTRFLCFKVYDDDIDYQPGDVCTILPTNSDENVDLFLSILNLNPKQRFRVEKRDSNYMVNYLYDFIPDGLQICDLVKYYLDIQSVPKRSFFEFLWPFSDDQLERDKLKEFASTEGQEEMYQYCIQPKRSILEVLLDFPNTVKNIVFEYLFDLIPPIKPRSFSVASSSSNHPNEVHFIVGVVNYRTRLKKIRRGLCSNYLARIKPIRPDQKPSLENRLRFFIRQTSFKLPEDKRIPIIMIGPGLGIAPFRSFIEELAIQSDISNLNRLYFGCRRPHADFYFKRELENYVIADVFKLRVAFSREVPKKYVQDLLLEDSTLIKSLILNDRAMIYVAGNSKLPDDLRQLFKKILYDDEEDSGESLERDKLITELESQNRIQYDCW